MANAASRTLEVRIDKVDVKGRKPDGKPVRTALDLDRVIHERLRLGIVSALAANDRLTFNDLKRLLQTTDGNLSVHARKLEDAGYIKIEKSFLARKPLTRARLTPTGKKAFAKYLEAIGKLIEND